MVLKPFRTPSRLDPCWPRGTAPPSMHVRVRACMRAWPRARTRACAHACVHACGRPCACRRACTHARMHARGWGERRVLKPFRTPSRLDPCWPRGAAPPSMHVRVRACVHACVAARAHACMHACMRACMRAGAHAK